MIITQPSYLRFGRTDPKNTFLRYTNIVSNIKKAKYLAIDAYILSEYKHNFGDFEKLLEENKHLMLLVDCSAEMLSGNIEFLLNSSYADRILILSNGASTEDNNILIKESRVKHIQEDFFIKYYHYYIPDLTLSEDQGYGKNHYLLLTGKPKIEREAFLSKLHRHGLTRYGNISYFGKSLRNKFNNVEPPNDKYYWNFLGDHIQEFKDSLESDLVLDVGEWNYTDSHTRFYNARPYQDVDFVIVFESDLYQDIIFHTEKSTKPIQLNKKFILINKKGALADLKQKFLKYHNRDISELTDWIDTSYDDIEDHNDRFDFIVKILYKKFYDYSQTI